MDGVALPVCVDNVAAGQIVKTLAVVRVRPQAHGAVGKCALTPVDVLLREHSGTISGFLCKYTDNLMQKHRTGKNNDKETYFFSVQPFLRNLSQDNPAT